MLRCDAVAESFAQNGTQIFFRCGHSLQSVFFLQRAHHIRRKESGQGRAEPDIPDAQRQQCNEDAYGFLLELAQHQRERQVVDRAVKGIGQRQRDAHGAVGVVALTDVQDAGQTGHRAQRQIVQAELAAGQR